MTRKENEDNESQRYVSAMHVEHAIRFLFNCDVFIVRLRNLSAPWMVQRINIDFSTPHKQRPRSHVSNDLLTYRIQIIVLFHFGQEHRAYGKVQRQRASDEQEFENIDEEACNCDLVPLL